MEEILLKKAQIIQLNESAVRDHLGKMVRNTVEDTLNNMLDAEADRLCNAEKYQRHDARTDTLNIDLLKEQELELKYELKR